MTGRIIVGDNLVVLPTLESASVDACVTDPPYGIGFMGREWDTFKPGVAEKRVVDNAARESDNPNLKGRKRSPAGSPASVEYNRSLEGQRGFQSWTEGWAREVYRVLKPGGHLLVCGAPRSYHRMASGVEDAGFEIRDCIMWVFGSGFPKSHNLDGDWDGWGTALKPAWEPIIVARKPFAGTVAANMAGHGTGAINIGACRIHTNDELRTGSGGLPCRHDVDVPRGRAEQASATKRYQNIGGTDFAATPGPRGGDVLGRWPANLIHDGSDEVLTHFPESAGQQGDVPIDSPKTRNVWGSYARNSGMVARGDTGSAARFFYCAKTSRQDRNDGCEGMDRKPLNWSSGTQSPGTFQAEGTDRTSPNNHPTVKPTALMRYLVRLVTPPGGTVLDPFGGSGSTAKACIYEGFNYILIEREARYVDISESRVAFASEEQDNRTRQMGLPV